MTELSLVVRIGLVMLSPLRWLINFITRRSPKLVALREDLGAPVDVTNFDDGYELVTTKYRQGKPDAVFHFFSSAEVRTAYRAFFYDSLSKEQLLTACTDFLKKNKCGDDLRILSIDARGAALELLDQLKATFRNHTYPTAAHDHSVLADIATKVNSRPNAQPSSFERAIRDWFSVLGYSFEHYEWRDNAGFHLVINVPARRGYDRIFILCIENEARAEAKDRAARLATSHHCIEAWVVAPLRVSPAARELCTPQDKPLVAFYTFDELIDMKADFSTYIEWLEREVETRGIDQHYVPLACVRDELDRDSGQVIRRSRYGERQGYIDGYLDRWLLEPTQEHVSVLGEFGTGKTWLSLHYASVCLKRYKDAKERGLPRPRLPIVVPLRDYAKAVSVESLFSEFFFRRHEIDLGGYSVFDRLNRMGRFLLIFDGFDEMAERIDRQKMINNFWELAKVVVPGAKALLTCRTEHFPSAREGRSLLSAELRASTSHLSGEPPQFEVLELERLNDDQIRKILSRHASQRIIDKILSHQSLRELASRPVMIDLIISAMPDIDADMPLNMARIYLYATTKKMRTDIKNARTFTSLADKVFFLSELSWEMLTSDKLSLNFRLFPDRLRQLFGSEVQAEKDLDHWHHDMMGQTMLIRNADGDYSPAHKSLIEFFSAYRCAASLGILSEDFEAVSREASATLVDFARIAQNSTWSRYFRRNSDEDTLKAPLAHFECEDVAIIVGTAGALKFDNTILHLLSGMVDRSRLEGLCVRLSSELRERSAGERHYLMGNLVALLARQSPRTISRLNLAGLDIRGVSMDHAHVYEATFDSADMSECSLEHTRFVDCSFRNANLSGIELASGWITGMSDQEGGTLDFYYGVSTGYPQGNDGGNDAGAAAHLGHHLRPRSITVVRTVDKREVWATTLEGTYLPSYAVADGNLLLIVMGGSNAAGDGWAVDVKSGTLRSASESQLKPLRLWQGSDLEGATGLRPGIAAVLWALGARNVPNLQDFDPRSIDYPF